MIYLQLVSQAQNEIHRKDKAKEQVLIQGNVDPLREQGQSVCQTRRKRRAQISKELQFVKLELEAVFRETLEVDVEVNVERGEVNLAFGKINVNTVDPFRNVVQGCLDAFLDGVIYGCQIEVAINEQAGCGIASGVTRVAGDFDAGIYRQVLVIWTILAEGVGLCLAGLSLSIGSVEEPSGTHMLNIVVS